MTGAPAAGAGRVTTLELFFDLVFVFTITQLTTVLVEGPQPRALLEVALMLGVIFWMYSGYAWLTNSVALDRVERRLVLLGGMAGFLVIALAIPGAFHGDGTAFGIAYLVVVTIHAGLDSRTASEGSRRGMLRIAPFSFGTAGLVLVAGPWAGCGVRAVGARVPRRMVHSGARRDGGVRHRAWALRRAPRPRGDHRDRRVGRRMTTAARSRPTGRWSRTSTARSARCSPPCGAAGGWRTPSCSSSATTAASASPTAADVREQANLAGQRPEELGALRGAWEAIEATLLPYPG